VRQWVRAVPKRLHYFLQNSPAMQTVVLRIVLRVVERGLRKHTPGRSTATPLGAVVFIHRSGSSLYAHVYLHCCIVDGAFESAVAADGGRGWCYLTMVLFDIDQGDTVADTRRCAARFPIL
jgi:hypothetical protein